MEKLRKIKNHSSQHSNRVPNMIGGIRMCFAWRSLVDIDRRFGGSNGLHHQGDALHSIRHENLKSHTNQELVTSWRITSTRIHITCAVDNVHFGCLTSLTTSRFQSTFSSIHPLSFHSSFCHCILIPFIHLIPGLPRFLFPGDILYSACLGLLLSDVPRTCLYHIRCFLLYNPQQSPVYPFCL